MKVCNSLLSIKYGVVVYPIFLMLPLQMQSEDGVGLGKLSTSLVPLTLESGLDTLIPVLLTLQGVLFAPVFYRVLSAINSCIIGVLSACIVCITPVQTVISS